MAAAMICSSVRVATWDYITTCGMLWYKPRMNGQWNPYYPTGTYIGITFVLVVAVGVYVPQPVRQYVLTVLIYCYYQLLPYICIVVHDVDNSLTCNGCACVSTKEELTDVHAKILTG